MTQEMKATQLFCLSNWEVYRSSLRMRLRAEYTDGTRMPLEKELDLSASEDAAADGLIVILQPENSLFLLGILPDEGIASVTLELESALGALRNLNLQYAFAEADEAFSNQIQLQDEPLYAEKLVFTPDGDRITVAFSTAQAEPTAQSEAAVQTAESRDADDILGDIAADLRMLACFSGASAAREAANALRQVQTKLECGTISAEAAAQAVTEQERVLVSCIDGTQGDLQFYRQEIISETDNRRG